MNPMIDFKQSDHVYQPREEVESRVILLPISRLNRRHNWGYQSLMLSLNMIHTKILRIWRILRIWYYHKAALPVAWLLNALGYTWEIKTNR